MAPVTKQEKVTKPKKVEKPKKVVKPKNNNKRKEVKRPLVNKQLRKTELEVCKAFGLSPKPSKRVTKRCMVCMEIFCPSVPERDHVRKEHPCKQCGRRYVTVENLKRHYKKLHPSRNFDSDMTDDYLG